VVVIWIDQKWNLIYKGSKDGFKSRDFHSKCNNKPNTLVIIKSSNGNVFGGYTEKSWSNIDSISIGANSDLGIADKPNLKPVSWSNLGHFYVHPEYEYESDRAESFLAGSFEFQVSEIEVYTKIIK